MAGKWHLGLAGQPPQRPWVRRLVRVPRGLHRLLLAHLLLGHEPAGPGINPTHDLWHNEEEVWDNGQYFTELITEKAIDYIREWRARRNRSSCTWPTTRRTTPCTRRRSTWTDLRIFRGTGR